ncbi:MAG: hypothetical protein LBI91_06900 [Spirochaetaceae bacterium]|jgi:hypothetical protein|nr:hypothetical protein [Spirochaetaceae bacterium]
MSGNTKSGAFFAIACLWMAVFAVGGVDAQIGLPAAPPGPAEIVYEDIPAETAAYVPHSGTYRATGGTINSDVDVFMSVLDFNAVKMRNWFSYAGVDEKGINLGYAVKFSSAYLGISYGGSLIDDLVRRITNQDVLTLQKRDEIIKDASGTSARPELVDSEGKIIEGTTTSENTLGLIFGTGIFGFKLGFTAFLEGREIAGDLGNYEHAFESSLKPSLELGWNFPVGSVRTKIAIRGAYDMHQYISATGENFYYMPETSIERSFVDKEAYYDFTEPSGGFTLGFEFGLGANARAEFDLIGDVAYRIYRSNEQDGVLTVWKIINNPNNAAPVQTNTDIAAPEIFDLRISGSPVFAFTNDISDRLTIGARINLLIKYNIFTISQSLSNFVFEDATGAKLSTPVSGIEIGDSRFSITPELSLGTRFTLWPDHFSVHAGFGINLFSFSEKTLARTETPAGGVGIETTKTVRVLELPTTSITTGLTLNLTSDLALDVLAITSGLDVDATKLTILLTFKR